MGVVGSGATIGVVIESAYPDITSNQISWFHERDLATPLTEAADSRYDFGADMRTLYIYNVSYEDEGNYIIKIYHVTGNQSVTIHLNVQGEVIEHLVKWHTAVIITSNSSLNFSPSKGRRPTRAAPVI